MLARSAEALLTGLIDYAGLFPPASLPMADAIRNCEHYRRGEHAWMLGRFVVPLARLGEVPEAFAVSVLADEVPRRAVAAIESKRIVKADVPLFVEIPIDEDPAAKLDELKAAGAFAKMRTGGVTADAFPPVEHVARFIRRCSEKGVAFKATAGLHHPVRCVKPLTYEPGAPTGTMHGFLNVFVAALFPDEAHEVLVSGADDFRFDDDALHWRGRSARVADVEAMRRDVAISFGSCSFEEPIADLQELGIL
ncbi:MAG TPA: hypothetical protein VF698_08795 [Thermoanaerobaculia bacterium]|jgi:hypothetical protein